MADLPQIKIDSEKDIDRCFVCGPNNPIGLKIKFRLEDRKAIAEFLPTHLYQGWSGIVHGGIIHSLLDEGMSYAALFEGYICVTAEMHTRWKRLAKIGELLVITGSITRQTRRLLETQAAITLKDGTVIAEGDAKMFVIEKKENVLKRNA